ncbi:XRE family transcriptional regulator [Polymorphospora rubra]|uniref:XRE family transcriptional regulator n=1 Tax=Polymorphospora rubra TaxID=338584 RepID=A0A810MP10_9ACTN|nr:XRE family transcriptional regulator [Polymorphospora rubra]BCJ62987.1 XRE family transcriptional regulator [Polymorphospora rubra]
MENAENPNRSSLAQRLEELFDTVRPAGRDEPYTMQEVVDGLRERGTDMSRAYLGQLRAGKKTNPTLHHLQALADWFEVPLAYFFDDEKGRETRAELQRLRQLRELRDLLDNPGATMLAVNARALDPEGLLEVNEFVHRILRSRRTHEQP